MTEAQCSVLFWVFRRYFAVRVYPIVHLVSILNVIGLGCSGEVTVSPEIFVKRKPLIGGITLEACGDLVGVPDTAVCTGVLLHPRLVIYPSHCGIEIDEITVAGRLLPTERCQAIPNANLVARDIAYCLLTHSADSSSVFIPAMGCEVDQIVPGAELVVRGNGLPYRQERSAVVVVKDVSEDIIVSADGVGACRGDSGGPVTIELSNAQGSATRLVGLISFGPKGCQEGPIFINPIAPFVPWLESTTGIDLSPCGSAEGEWNPTPDCRATRVLEGKHSCRSEIMWDFCGPPAESGAEDRTPPDISFDEIFDMASMPGLFELHPVVHASDSESGVRQVTLILEDISGKELINEVRTLEPYEFGRTFLPPGSYQLIAEVVDYAHNVETIKRQIEVPAKVYPSGCSVVRDGASCWFLNVLVIMILVHRCRKRYAHHSKPI